MEDSLRPPYFYFAYIIFLVLSAGDVCDTKSSRSNLPQQPINRALEAR